MMQAILCYENRVALEYVTKDVMDSIFVWQENRLEHIYLL